MHPILLLRFLAATLMLTVYVSVATADDWLGFRGSDGSGVSEANGLPTSWSAGNNVQWQTPLPGPGASSPIVVGDRVYLTCYQGFGVNPEAPGDPNQLQQRVLSIRRADGEIVWNRAVPVALPAQAFEGFLTDHGFASSTPTSDGERVYVFFGQSGVFALDQRGEIVWQADVGSGKSGWGSASSPVIYGENVIVNAFVESRSLVALDRETGQEAWRLDGLRRTWSTPLLANTADGKTEIVISLQGEIWGVDPESGEKLWTCEGIDDYICPSPVAGDGVVYVIGGRSSRAFAIRLGGRGDVSDSHVVWEAKVGSNVPSPVLVDGYLYWVNHRGLAFCVDASTGEMVYRQRLPSAGGVYASLTAADGKLYAVSRERGTIVLAASPEFEVLAENSLSPDDSIFNASPAVADGTIYLRSNQALYAIHAGQ